MRSRRDFLKHLASGTAGLVLARGLTVPGPSAQRAAARYGAGKCPWAGVASRSSTCTATVSSRRSRTSSRIRPLAARSRTCSAAATSPWGPDRLRYLDEQGIDVQAISINAFWYGPIANWLARSSRFRTRSWRRGVRRSRIVLSGWLRSRCSIRIWRPSNWTKPSSSSGCAARRSAGASKAKSFGAEVRSVLGEGGRAWRPGLHASAAGAGHDSESARCRARAGSATSSATRSRRPSSSRI